MAIFGLKKLMGAALAGSLMFCSTVAAAAAPIPAPQVNPWAALSAMSAGAPAAAMCGAAATAAAMQAPGGCVLPVLDMPPPPPLGGPAPPPPIAASPSGVGVSPLIFGLLALAAGIGIYLAIHHNGTSNSPA